MFSPKTPTPKQDFKERLKSAKKSGSTVKSDKKKSIGRVVEFEDGATLRLLSTGHMVHDFPDGSKVQRNPDGAEIKIDSDGTKTQENPNGNLVVQHTDGTTVTHVADTGEKVFVYADGTTKQVDPDADVVATPKATPRKSTSKKNVKPKKLFNKRLRDEKKNGKKVVSDKRKTTGRLVEFDDGTKLRLFNTGLLVHDYPDGTKYQRNIDGTGIQIQADGTKVQENPNGNTVYQYMDGTQVTHVARTGEKIYVYPDGSTKQVDADGGGVIVDEAGQRSDFKEGGDAEFEAKRLAKAKEPLDESLENHASSTEEEPDSPDDTKQTDNFWATLKAERAARKAKAKFLANANRKRKEKRKNRRMVPLDQMQQVTAAQADKDLADFQFDIEAVEAERQQRDNRMKQALLGSDTPSDTPSDFTSIASTEYSFDPVQECNPDRCCWMDLTPTPKSEVSSDKDRACEECTIM